MESSVFIFQITEILFPFHLICLWIGSCPVKKTVCVGIAYRNEGYILICQIVNNPIRTDTVIFISSYLDTTVKKGEIQ